MKKLFLIIPSLHRGGAERVVSILANHLDRNIFDTTLVLLEKRGSYLKDLYEDIKIIDLQQKRVSSSILPLVKLINKQKPDLVFSTLGHLNLSLMFLKIFLPKETKFIAREASIPSILNKGEKYPKLFNLLYKKLYPKFDKIICQSNYMLNDLNQNFSIDKSKMVVINNPIDFEKIEQNLLNEKVEDLLPHNKKNIIAVGSLEAVKGYEQLIEAFVYIKRKDIMLSIIGEGSKKEELEKMILDFGLNDRVKLLGFKDNPYQYMKQAKLLVLTSQFEGFPNTVLEAMACGVPVVAYKCPGGIEEIILEDKNGWFVKYGDIYGLAKAIEKHIEHKLDIRQVKKSVYDRYNLKYIIKKYENLLVGL